MFRVVDDFLESLYENLVVGDTIRYKGEVINSRDLVEQNGVYYAVIDGVRTPVGITETQAYKAYTAMKIAVGLELMLAANPELLEIPWVKTNIGRLESLALKDYCFLAGTPISMWDGEPKAIEDVCIGDVVVSYDDQGRLRPGKVTDTIRNRKKLILDFHGLMVTPGHVVLCADGANAGLRVPMIDVLKSDSALVREDGSLVRAATGEPVGSIADEFVKCVFVRLSDPHSKSSFYEGEMRVGTRLLKSDGSCVSVLDCIRSEGMEFDEETGLVAKDCEEPHRLLYYGEQPRPEAYVLSRSGISMEQIQNEGEWEQVGTLSHSTSTIQ